MKNILKLLTISFLSMIILNGCANTYNTGYSAPVPATVQEKRESLNSLTSNYYKNRDVLQIPIILQYLSDLNALEKKNYNSQITGFLVGVIHQGNRKQVSEWKKLPITSITKNVITRAVIIEPSIEKILNENSYAPDSASVDFYWGYFGATYDQRCVQIIINTKNDKKINPITRAAAQFSLNANRNKYKVVEDMLLKDSKN